MSTSIYLSKKHGIAPALCVCWFCGKDNGEIALLGTKADRIPNFGYGTKVEGSICDSCKKSLAEGAVGFFTREGGRIMLSAVGVQNFNAQFPDHPVVAGMIYEMDDEPFNHLFADALKKGVSDDLPH